MNKLYQAEYGWDVARDDGVLEHGDLYVDDDGVVRWKPQNPSVDDAQKPIPPGYEA